MRPFVALFLICLLLTACTGSSKKTIFINRADYVEVKICTNTTAQELTMISDSLLHSHQIKLDFSGTTYQYDGCIDQLKMEIKAPGGIEAKLDADLYMSDGYFGFFRNYARNAHPPFRCGDLSESL